VDGTVLLGLAGIGATLTAGVAGAGAVLVVARWERQDSQRHRFTDTKRLAYVGFLAAMDEWHNASLQHRLNPKARPYVLDASSTLRYQQSVSEVSFVASLEVTDKLEHALTAVKAVGNAARSSESEWSAARAALRVALGEFTMAARKDLGMPTWPIDPTAGA
jgi:hypothetical protein